MSWEQALRAGYTGRIELAPYLRWLKTLPCDTCGRAGTDHNPIDPSHYNGYKGAGTKAPDPMSIPQCRVCHERYERAGDPQFLTRAALYLTRAIWEGRLVWRKVD